LTIVATATVAATATATVAATVTVATTAATAVFRTASEAGCACCAYCLQQSSPVESAFFTRH
jgi:hypothetical protein